MRMLVAVMLMVAAACPVVAWAKAEEPLTDTQVEQMGLQAEIRMRQLDIEAREAELDFQRQMHDVELARHRAMLGRHGGREGVKGLILVLMILVHALATVWVYKDMQDRKKGSGLWIPIVLIGGLVGLLTYGVIRTAEACEAMKTTPAQNT